MWVLGNKTLQDQELAAQGFKKIDQPDSDGDSLADWEEELWETDPQKPDTDGDGASDGEEIKARRDPRRAGPGDEIQTAKDNLNILIYQALKSKDNGLIIPETPLASPSVKQVKVTTTNERTAEEAIQYARKFVAATAPYLQYSGPNPEKSLLEKIDNEKSSATENLTNYGYMLEGVTQSLEDISTPEEVSSHHIKLITQIKKMAVLVQNMLEAEKQPIIALQAGQQFPIERAYVSQAILDINQYLIRYGVSLTPEMLSGILRF